MSNRRITGRSSDASVGSNASNISSGVSTPIRSRLAPSARSSPATATRAGGVAVASPQVRARLQELRKQAKASSSPASNVLDDSLAELSISDSLRPSSRASNDTLLRMPSPVGTGGGNDAGRDSELVMPSLNQAIEKAKTTGRLNISSNSLTEMPSDVYEELMPRTSIYHPCSSTSKQTTISGPPINLAISSEDQDRDHTGPKWWELQDLTSLKASNNELVSIDESLAGFETLEVLDLHNNQIVSPIPSSFALLANLTSLNLASNKLVEFPIELMALVHLKELDLSQNQLTSLWPRDWSATVKSTLKSLKDKKRRRQRGEPIREEEDNSIADVSFESTTSSAADTSAGEDFWSTFPSSPVKGSSAAYSRTAAPVDYTTPLPSLVSLRLQGNSLSPFTFTYTSIGSLPLSLVTLDLSRNNLSGPLPLSLFSSLDKLKSLNLAKNNLSDDIFVPSHTHSSSSSSPLVSLESLNLSQNAIDTLAPLETSLGTSRPLVYTGVSSVSLSRYLNSASKTMQEEQPDVPVLYINLTENFLREELVRRRKGKSTANPSTSKSEENQQCTSSRKQDGQSSSIPSSTGQELLELVDRFRDHLAASQHDDSELSELSILLGPLREHMKKQEGSEKKKAKQEMEDRAPVTSLAARRKQQQQADALWAPL